MRFTRGHLLFMALRDIGPGEEITCDYISTHHPDDYRCRCKARAAAARSTKRKPCGAVISLYIKPCREI